MCQFSSNSNFYFTLTKKMCSLDRNESKWLNVSGRVTEIDLSTSGTTCFLSVTGKTISCLDILVSDVTNVTTGLENVCHGSSGL